MDHVKHVAKAEPQGARGPFNAGGMYRQLMYVPTNISPPKSGVGLSGGDMGLSGSPSRPPSAFAARSTSGLCMETVERIPGLVMCFSV